MFGPPSPNGNQTLTGLRALLDEHRANRNVLRILATRRTWVSKATALLEFDDTLHANALVAADILCRPGFSSTAYEQAEGRMLMLVEQGVHKLELGVVKSAPSSTNVVFISHTATEAKLAIALKNFVETAFAGRIRVFVSSDERDLRPGDRWLQEIDEALLGAGALIVVCSQFAVTRPWIHFESGCAWIRKVPIIPVCHSGLKKSELAPPLSTFQGLTIDESNFAQRLAKALASHFDYPVAGKLRFAAFDKALRKAASAAAALVPNISTVVSVSAEPKTAALSADEERLMKAATASEDGCVIRTELHDGYEIQVGGKALVAQTHSPRIRARWERVLQDLVFRGFLSQRGNEIYEVTDEGYRASE